MNATTNPLTALAGRARAGDVAAAEGLRRHLESRMAGTVRQVLRTGGGGSALDRAILRECRDFDPDAQDEQALVEAVARRVSRLSLGALEGPPARRHALADTLRGF